MKKYNPFIRKKYTEQQVPHTLGFSATGGIKIWIDAVLVTIPVPIYDWPYPYNLGYFKQDLYIAGLISTVDTSTGKITKLWSNPVRFTDNGKVNDLPSSISLREPRKSLLFDFFELWFPLEPLKFALLKNYVFQVLTF